MPSVTYIDSAGNPSTVNIDTGVSVMEGAVRNDIEGIVAECGGACACATCHVYVDPDWLDKLPEMDGGEDAMLDCTAAERRDNSRLSCQLSMSEDMDGLVVHLPETQTL